MTRSIREYDTTSPAVSHLPNMIRPSTNSQPYKRITAPKFNIASEKLWLEDYFPIWKVTFQGRTVKLREGMKPQP